MRKELWTDEQRAVHSKKLKEAWARYTPEERAARVKALKESQTQAWNNKTPEEREEWKRHMRGVVGCTSEGAKSRWSDPEQRRLQSERIADAHWRRRNLEQDDK